MVVEVVGFAAECAFGDAGLPRTSGGRLPKVVADASVAVGGRRGPAGDGVSVHLS